MNRLAESVLAAFRIVVFVASFALMVPSAFADDQGRVLVGNCLPVPDNQIWDCRIDGNATASGDFKVACESGEVKPLDQEWFALSSLSELDEYIDKKYAVLGFRGFTQWTACQGLETELSAREEGRHVFSLQVDVYSSGSPNKKPMTENWPWWCAEMPSLSAVFTDGLFGCFVPEFYTVETTFASNGQIKERAKQVPY